MKVTLIDVMGDDLRVVNAARVSFRKKVDEFTDNDEKLIKYLARHNHWTPFAHAQVSLHMKAPVFVRTQCFKHKQGFVENEVSRRYVDDPPEVFHPDTWRKRAENKKQGSGEPFSDELQGADTSPQDSLSDVYTQAVDAAMAGYEALIDRGVAPEQARMVLPQSMYTEWYWTGSLAAYARFCGLRLDDQAQKEIQILAGMVSQVIAPHFPVSWKALAGH